MITPRTPNDKRLQGLSPALWVPEFTSIKWSWTEVVEHKFPNFLSQRLLFVLVTVLKLQYIFFSLSHCSETSLA
jgi:hypothetical protein